ncbi:MAG TPA: DUF2927 domain-containing protein [Longimicrobiaceae bacterium]|nr:DUF2927 domain-containing protein [Longimicrobiaceae bacterium]
MHRREFGLLALFSCILGGCGGSPVSPSPVVATNPGVLSPELQYFEEIALGLEYGDAGSRVHKWTTNLRIQIHGSPTAADNEAVAQVISEVNGLVGSKLLVLVESGSNVDLWFAPVSQFPTLQPNYVSGNLGFVWIDWSTSGSIEHAQVLIASDRVTPEQRAHLIREELTQALGLLRDSDRYVESVFFEGWSESTHYAPIDETLIRMLYRPEVRAGMRRSEVLPVLTPLFG